MQTQAFQARERPVAGLFTSGVSSLMPGAVMPRALTVQSFIFGKAGYAVVRIGRGQTPFGCRLAFASSIQ
ncbi:MAG: hypothetical protein ABF491_11270 [Acetobacter sp.]|uniref:hypothetical protein n=1 Tax=Acetobacter sp. TaxID=440 RepID=UPI0039EB4D20